MVTKCFMTILALLPLGEGLRVDVQCAINALKANGLNSFLLEFCLPLHHFHHSHCDSHSRYACCSFHAIINPLFPLELVYFTFTAGDDYYRPKSAPCLCVFREKPPCRFQESIRSNFVVVFYLINLKFRHPTTIRWLTSSAAEALPFFSLLPYSPS